MRKNTIPNLISIDYVRFFLSISIAIWHYQLIISVGNLYPATFKDFPFSYEIGFFYTHGYLAVQFFWLISGYIISYIYLEGNFKIRDFLRNRFARLYPLHIVTLLITGILQIVALSKLGRQPICGSNDLKHFLLNLLFIPSIGLEDACSFNAPIWSVSVEIYSYLLFMCLFVGIEKYREIFCTVLIAIFSYIHHANIFLIPKQVSACAIFFFTGVLVFFLQKNSRPIIIILASSSIISFCILVKIGILKTGENIISNLFKTEFSYLLIFAPLLILLLYTEKLMTKKYLSRFWVIGKFLGNLTYSCYLWQFPLIIFILIIYGQNSNQLFIYAKNPLFLLSYLSILLVISYLSFRFIENPIRSYLRSGCR